MPTRQVRLKDADPSVPFLYQKGDRVAWRTQTGGLDREFSGVIIDGWCEYEVGGGFYQAKYLVERSDGMSFASDEARLVRIDKHPKSVYVRRYLSVAFPGWEITDGPHFERDSEWFRVSNVESGDVHKLLVSSEFLDDHSGAEIEALLKGLSLAQEMRRAGKEIVVVTNLGLRIGLR